MGIPVLIKRWWAVFVIIPSISCAQVEDDFSDGDFLSTPVWAGNIGLFKVNDDLQLQLNAVEAGQACLYTAIEPTLEYEWRCWIKMSFSPSGNNNSRIYLFTLDPDPANYPDGIFLQLGEAGASDAICLMEQSQGDTNTLIRGSPGAVAQSFVVRIKIIYSSGEWQLYVDYSGEDNYLIEGVASGSHIAAPGYLGVYCTYTISNSTKFYFDDFYAGPIQHDTIPPEALQVSVNSPFSVQVEFSERIDVISAEDVSNYLLSHAYGSPLSAGLIDGDASRVELTYSDSLLYGELMHLSIQNIADLTANIIVPVVRDLAYYHPVRYDVIINEIMADPSPPNLLPEYEYLELFNTTPLPLNLSGWTLIAGITEKPLNGLQIAPHGYVIIGKEGAEEQFIPIGQYYGLESFGLVNAGQSIALENENKEMIHGLSYTEKWYDDDERSGGGYSMEMINPYNPCGMQENWGASRDYRGGSPGKENSLYDLNYVDLNVKNICVIDSLRIKIEFNQSIHTSISLHSENFVLDRGLGAVEAILPDDPFFTSFILYPPHPLERNTIYELKIVSEVSNCIQDTWFISESMPLGMPEKPDEHDLIINEILFNPFPGGTDYIEIYNRSDNVIDLSGLSLASVNNSPLSPPDTSIFPLGIDCKALLPDRYALLCQDFNKVDDFYYCKNMKDIMEMDRFPSYGNESGCVILFDEQKRILDMLSYQENMQYPLLNSVEGVALERVHPDRPSSEITNWHSASQLSGFGTPAYQNSQFIITGETGGDVWISPKVFTPGYDGINDLINIHYNLGLPGYLATILIFNAAGQPVRHLVNNELLGAEGVYSWDGIKDDQQKASSGIYIVLIELIDLNGRVVRYKKTLIVAP